MINLYINELYLINLTVFYKEAPDALPDLRYGSGIRRHGSTRRAVLYLPPTRLRGSGSIGPPLVGVGDGLFYGGRVAPEAEGDMR